MQNFIKTIINGVQKWTKKEIKKSTADWNQNDSNAADYVKNRTHYIEDIEEVVIERQTIDFLDQQAIIFQDNKIHSWKNINVYVFWNGVTYDCFVNGNGAVSWINYNMNDPKIPFCIMFESDRIFFQKEDFNTSIEFGITREIIHKLNSKYLDIPTYLATTDDVKSVSSTVEDKMDRVNPVGSGSFSFNRKSGTTIGTFSVAMGYQTTASGTYSHAEGETTTASGYSSHAEGSGTVASMAYTHAEGFMTKAEHEGAHAEGYGTTASGWMSHAEGGETIASGVGSHAEGNSTTASGGGSHAEGLETIAASENQHVQGRYNVLYRLSFNDTKEKILLSTGSSYAYSSEYTFDPLTGVISLINAKSAKPNMIHIVSSPIYLENNGVWYQVLDNYDDYAVNTFTAIKINIVTYAHIVGNGTSDTERSNAHTLDWNGVGWFQGGLQIGGNAQDDGAKTVLLEGDAIPVPETADVGQVMRVKSVDENGKPVEWETTDISTSGGSGCVVSDTAPEDTSVLWIDTSDNSSDENLGGGNVGETEQLNMLIESDMLPAVHDANGAILTDENGKIILRY